MTKLARLYGGPADGLTIWDGNDIEWVAVTIDNGGRAIPEQHGAMAVTLPEKPSPETEKLMNAPGRRWESYRKIGTSPTGVDIDPRDDLPLPGDGIVAYRWIDRRLLK